MKTEYLPRFLKDLKHLKNTRSYSDIKVLAFETFPSAGSLSDIPHLKEIRHKGNFFRVRVNDYRIGFRLDNDTVIFMRALHRKDMYRYPEN